MERKKVILTLSKAFMSGHKRCGDSTLFAVKLFAGQKIHTIRKDAKAIWEQRVADINAGKKMLCVREWTGRPYNSEQNEIKNFVEVGLQHITMTYGTDDAVPQAWVDDKPVPVEQLAKNDGLTTEDFVDWFFGGNNKENVFEGVIIHFTDFRY